MSKKKIDEGLEKALEKGIREAIKQFGLTPSLHIYLASYLKKEGWVKVNPLKIIRVDSAQLLCQKPCLEIPKGTKIAILDEGR